MRGAVDGQHDGTFEILDLRPTRDRRTERTEAGSARLDDWAVPAPAIHLKGGSDAAPPSPARPKWQNWAIMVAVFVAGVAAGGYGWYARSEAVDAGRVELIALDFNGAVADNIEKSRLHATIHNAGARDVVVLGLRVPGWQAAPEEIRREVTIP